MKKDFYIQLPRFPEYPSNILEQEEAITKLCFVSENIAPADVAFIFGCPPSAEMLQTVDNIIQKTACRQFILTGGAILPDTSLTESEAIRTELYTRYGKALSLYQENISQNTIGDVQEALKIFDFDSVKRILCVAQYYSSRRQIETLQTYLLGKQLFSAPWLSFYNGYPVSPVTWSQLPETCSLVWGEVLRMYHYHKAGHIKLSVETLKNLQQIILNLGLSKDFPLKV